MYETSSQASFSPLLSCPLCDFSDLDGSKNEWKSSHVLQAHILSRHAGRGMQNSIPSVVCQLCYRDRLAWQIGLHLDNDEGSSCLQRHANELLGKEKKNCLINETFCYCPLCWKRFDLPNVHKSLKSSRGRKPVTAKTAEARLQMHILMEHGWQSIQLMRSVIGAKQNVTLILKALLDCSFCGKEIYRLEKVLFELNDSSSFTCVLNEVFNLRIRHLNSHARHFSSQLL
ncbi:hypothetical protein Ciccas_012004 [Cichlidogyrus casuarinus]|uniref:Uncharacterized protein n=1 Tax=Cichlidogyrus casuarinus TaxID=1844966 RepID=A0ABD2PPN5_9PLAT